MLAKARIVLKALNILNWGVGVILIAFLGYMGFAAPGRLMAIARTGHPSLNPEAVVLAVRGTVLLLPVMAWLVDRILRTLVAIINTIPSGQAFTAANAVRLRRIAWFMLAIYAIDLVWGVALYSQLGPYSGWSFTLSGWVASMMLFILASVWQDGVAMRDDLEGTV